MADTSSLELDPPVDERDSLSSLPCPLLLLCLAPCTASELVRLSVCSMLLSETVAGADACWEALCRGRAFVVTTALQPPRGDSWQTLYLRLRSRLCRECGVPSPYVFPLISHTYRLCERCEPTNPRYQLVTAAEALAGGATRAQLAALPSKELRGLLSPAVEKRLRAGGQALLYLRSAVEGIARAAQQETAVAKGQQQLLRPPWRRAAGGGDDDTQFALSDEEGGGGGGAASGGGGSDVERSAADDGEGGSSDGDGETAPSPRRPSGAEAKAERKARKTAVKAANRLRRAAKGDGGGGRDIAAGSEASSGAAMGSALRLLSRSAGASPPAAWCAPSAGGGAGGSGSAAPPRRFGGAGAPPGAAGAWDAAPRSAPGAAALARRAKADGRMRSLALGSSPDGGGPAARARLDEAVGEFGLSGLQLAV